MNEQNDTSEPAQKDEEIWNKTRASRKIAYNREMSILTQQQSSQLRVCKLFINF